MRGVVDDRAVVRNFSLIWREFGAGCAFRCAAAVICRRKATFLEVAIAPPLSRAGRPAGLVRRIVDRARHAL